MAHIVTLINSAYLSVVLAGHMGVCGHVMFVSCQLHLKELNK